ncbi:MAG: hypothetical protein AAF637_25860 [Pseudomonadota bacterium]
MPDLIATPTAPFNPPPFAAAAQALRDNRLPFGGGRAEAVLQPSRGNLIADLGASIEARDQAIRHRFEHSGQSGGVNLPTKDRSRLIDQLFCQLLERAAARVGSSRCQLTVLAMGEYGRFSLAPYSIPELAFILPPGRATHSRVVIESLLEMLWDLGLRAHHRAHTAAEWIELSRDQQRYRMALLESRPVWGRKDLHRALVGRFSRSIVATMRTRLIAEIWSEQTRRYTRFGNARDAVSPHVVEGEGGLLDLGCLRQLAKLGHGPQEQRSLYHSDALGAADNFLTAVRCHLHYLCGKAHDRLDQGLQPEIAIRMGYVTSARSEAELLMHDYRNATDAVSGMVYGTHRAH